LAPVDAAFHLAELGIVVEGGDRKRRVGEACRRSEKKVVTMSLGRCGNLMSVALLATLAACGFARVPYDQSSGGQGAAGSACVRETGNAGEVRVCPGDTLSALARSRNVTVAGLMQQNGLASDRIYAGQILHLQDGATGGSGTTVAAAPARLPDSPPVSSAPPSGGVTIGSGVPPAAAPAVSASESTAASARGTPPGPAAPGVSPPLAPVEPKPPAAAAPDAAADPPPPRQRAAEPATRAAAAAPPAAAAAAPKPTPKPAGPAPAGGAFLLPVQGRIISEFGPKSGGLHNDGINIAAPRGTPFAATADGEVAYAGDGLPGFGNLILVRHADGWTSAYAHADTMGVKRGDTVQRGQTLGTVGSTGSVTDPQLHFELRRHDKAVDPKPLLGS
jgi:murein DD-endopeptidase MepM/ murein hydrolase activator NlpD